MARGRGRWQGSLAVTVGLLVAMVSLGLGLGVGRNVAAQEAAHPAHIHTGSCAELGDVVLPLTDVAVAAADGEMMGPESAIPVKMSETTVDMALADIVAGGHAINVHESADNIGLYIACGDIGGHSAGDRLVIGLGELNDSGHTGVAILEGTNGETAVTIYLVEGEAAEEFDTEEGAGAASPAAAAEGVAVDIVDFTYNPNPVEIAVGDSITWTNQDGVPHTATGQDRELLQSGTLNQGDSYSQAFEEAGSFDYFCEFHPNMQGTIVVQ